VIDFDNYPGSKTVLGRLLRLPLAAIPKTAIVPILNGPLKGKRWIVGSGIHRLWLGSYEPAKMNLAAKLVNRGDVVFDIGANVGIYTLLFSEAIGRPGRVFAFEPSPLNVRHLERHLELNRVWNVEVVEVAVSDSSGTATFDTTSGSCTGRLETGGDLAVDTTTIDEFVGANHVRPSLIKIDVEGSEALVLRGAARTLRELRPQILLATHSADIKRECLDILAGHDYDVREIADGGVVHADELVARPSAYRRRQMASQPQRTSRQAS